MDDSAGLWDDTTASQPHFLQDEDLSGQWGLRSDNWGHLQAPLPAFPTDASADFGELPSLFFHDSIDGLELFTNAAISTEGPEFDFELVYSTVTSNVGTHQHCNAGNPGPYQAPVSVQGDVLSQRQVQRQVRPFTCDYSGCRSRGFGRKYELQRHMKKHSRQQTFPCPVTSCRFQEPENAFYRHDKLRSHMKSCHPGVQISPANASVAPDQPGTHGNMAHSMAAMAHSIPTHNAFQG